VRPVRPRGYGRGGRSPESKPYNSSLQDTFGGWELAYKVIIRCQDAEDVIRLLKEKHGADYSRVWRIDNRTIGVFSFERSGILTSSGHVNLITLDHDKTLETCEVTIMYAGGGAQSLISFTEISNSGVGALQDLVSLAKERGWDIHVEKAKIKARGSPCPNCDSAYVYSKDKIRADGSVTCQNCGKPFMIQEE